MWTYKHAVVIGISFLLGIAFLRLVQDTFPGERAIPKDIEQAVCEGESAGREDAASIFCTLVQDQIDPNACVKLPQIQAIMKKTGDTWIRGCMGIDRDPRAETPSSSKDFEQYGNVNPLQHR